MVVLTIGGAVMWSMHQLELENILQSRTVEVEIQEYFPEDDIETSSAMTKEVSFINTGTASVFLRFSYAEYWETESELLEGYSDSVTKNWSSDVWTDWYDDGDGWYYYTKVLPAGESVDILESVKFADDSTIPEDANYNLFFQVETVQVSDEESLNTEAIQLLFNKSVALRNTTIVEGAVTSGIVDWSVYDSEE